MVRHDGNASARRRRGKVLIMTALLLPALVGFVALGVDLAVLAVARSHLATAADAASLAGVAKLATENRIRGAMSLSAEMAEVRDQAVAFSAANPTLGSPTVVERNDGNAESGGVVIGYINLAAIRTPMVTSAALEPLYNSVRVRAAATVPSFFSQIMGFRSFDVRVAATATVHPYTVTGFQQLPGLSPSNIPILPITLDDPTRQEMFTGATADDFTYDEETRGVVPGPDTVHESQLYPIRRGAGNWGTINIGTDNNSAQTLGAQIRYGITPEQLATYRNGEIKLDETRRPPSIVFEGDPGITASIKDDLQAIIGKPVFVPIHDPAQTTGRGDNLRYTIIDFQPARILEVDFRGSPKRVVIQPCLIDHRDAIPGSPRDSWLRGGLLRLFLSR